MSDYSRSINFTAKDALPSGNINKIVSGVDIDSELDAVATSIATKANSASPTITSPTINGTMTLGASVSGSGTIDAGEY